MTERKISEIEWEFLHDVSKRREALLHTLESLQRQAADDHEKISKGYRPFGVSKQTLVEVSVHQQRYEDALEAALRFGLEDLVGAIADGTRAAFDLYRLVEREASEEATD